MGLEHWLCSRTARHWKMLAAFDFWLLQADRLQSQLEGLAWRRPRRRVIFSCSYYPRLVILAAQ